MNLFEIKKLFNTYPNLFNRRLIIKKEILIQDGEISNSVYFVRNGILRLWHNSDGNDITLQFFKQNQFVKVEYIDGKIAKNISYSNSFYIYII